MPHGTIEWALFASFLTALLVLARVIWLSAKWGRRRHRIVMNRLERGVEDICWEFCREDAYLRALNLRGARLREWKAVPERLLKAVE